MIRAGRICEGAARDFVGEGIPMKPILRNNEATKTAEVILVFLR